MDKRAYLSKVNEPNEQFQTLAIDIMMYSKHKIANSIQLDGVTDLLRKLKISMLKIIAN
jgi:hypothetical protein